MAAPNELPPAACRRSVTPETSFVDDRGSRRECIHQLGIARRHSCQVSALPLTPLRADEETDIASRRRRARSCHMYCCKSRLPRRFRCRESRLIRFGSACTALTGGQQDALNGILLAGGNGRNYIARFLQSVLLLRPRGRLIQASIAGRSTDQTAQLASPRTGTEDNGRPHVFRPP